MAFGSHLVSHVVIISGRNLSDSFLYLNSMHEVFIVRIVHYRTVLDLLHCKCIENYSMIWGHIALFISRIDRTVHVYTSFTSKHVSCMYRRDTYKFYMVRYVKSCCMINIIS